MTYVGIILHVSPPIPRDFWFLSNHTHNHWNTYSSFFDVGMMASSTKTICLKNNNFQVLLGLLLPSQSSNVIKLAITASTHL